MADDGADISFILIPKWLIEFLLAHETMSAEEFEAVFTDEAAGHDKI